MRVRRVLASGAFCLALFSVLCVIYLSGVEVKAYTEVRALDENIQNYSVYESETLDLVGFSKDDVTFSAVAFRGESVYVNVKGDADKLYSITVFNPSGKSSSAELVTKRAGKDGSVYWSWKISDNVSDGYIRVIVSGENEYAQMKIEIK